MSDIGKFKEQLPSKERVYSLLTGKKKKLVSKNVNIILRFGPNLK